ncbi:MAG: efflux RND transporter permease subunit [Deltaproteobacteria bacterium]|nr:efflux RND transporter permease subunit [Deltaproteobacteria bacterium]MBW1736442.1 efflux RND transporter permease subunit [Deltaproteobacteria bacterium]MBW1909105.1 efflux RND transporter permease subunit [Deltaproteobacteria bacterium]MBW2032171.1 efflux RND transporter permease subunit [Deltaproteobacteria bacterium]MBW2113813.1 efflux RND transporter permease subunit [Deltaproteobacteria bacterium]
MRIPEFSVHRPVTVLMFILIIVVLGAISLFRLPIEIMPDLTYPVAAVITSYESAASEDVENRVTKVIETAVSQVKNVKTVNSTSMEGISLVLVEFEWGTNIDFGAQDMRDGIGMLKKFLPSEIDDPIVVKFDPSMIPVIVYGITGKRDLRDLRTLIKDDIKDRIEMVDGVANAFIMGGREREIQVLIDRARLESLGIPIQQVVARLRYENLNLSGGHITRGHTEYLLRTIGEFKNLDQIRDTIVSVQNGAPIYIKDIATVKDTHKEIRCDSHVNRANGVMLLIIKESGANTAQVVSAVKKQVRALKKELPPDIEFYITLDQGDLTEKIVAATAQDAVWGGLIAMILILLVLRNWRPTITIGLSIPLSILATFVIIYAFDFTFNAMTMSGIALGVGMLVSNAIIVIENIYRHMEEKKDRFRAAIDGTGEVGMAIAASTFTTIAVFLPMFFATGIAGKLSRGLALTVAVSLLASLFVALTLVPMMASKIFRLKDKAKKEGIGKKSEGVIRKIYGSLLSWALRNRWKVTLTSFAVFGASLVLIPYVGKEFMPPIDTGLVIIKVEMPVGTELDETCHLVDQIENIMSSEKELDVIGSITGVAAESELGAAFGMTNIGINEAQIFAHAVDKNKRKRTTMQIQESIRKKLPGIKGTKIEFMDLARMITSAGTGQVPIEVKIFGKETDKLGQMTDALALNCKEIKGLYDVDTTLRRGKPEIHFKIDREKAAKIGLSVAQVASTIRASFAGEVATLYRTGGDEFDLRVKYREADRMTFENVEDILMAAPLGSQHRLSDIAKISKGKGPSRLFRENQKRKASVTANFSGRDLGSILADIKTNVAKVDFPQGYFVEYGGEIKRMRETFFSLGAAFVLAILLVYMVMAAQFESLLHPFTVMFTAPLGLIGVIAILLLTGNTLSMPSLLGIIILAGVVVNNGIVLVDYVNQLRKRGMPKDEAIIEGSITKLRAMLLTAIVAMIGMLPMAITRGMGAEMRAPIALSVIGGMVVSTFLMLVIIPTLYSIFDDLGKHTKQKTNQMLHGKEG